MMMIRAKQVMIRAKQVMIRAKQVMIRAKQVVIRAKQVVVRAKQVVIRAKQVVIRAKQVVIRTKEAVGPPPQAPNRSAGCSSEVRGSEFKSEDPGFDPWRGRVRGSFSVPPSQLLCRLVCA